MLVVGDVSGRESLFAALRKLRVIGTRHPRWRQGFAVREGALWFPNGWRVTCGAAPGEPCTVISGGDGLNPGDPRPELHFYRMADEAPAVAVKDEPGYADLIGLDLSREDDRPAVEFDQVERMRKLIEVAESAVAEMGTLIGPIYHERDALRRKIAEYDKHVAEFTSGA